MSKKGTSRRMLPNHSNLTAEEVRKSPKSTVDELIEAGDTASSKPLRIDRIELKESVDEPIALLRILVDSALSVVP
jgi:hypothetical protein